MAAVRRGAKDNERRMVALGHPVYQLVAFVISGMLAGLAGVLRANASGFIGPADLAWTRSGELIVMVVLGGMSTVTGPILGAAALLLLEEFAPHTRTTKSRPIDALLVTPGLDPGVQSGCPGRAGA